LSQVVKNRLILGHHKDPARLFTHVDQSLHLIGRRASKKTENQ
jgi:hypothetical protein